MAIDPLTLAMAAQAGGSILGGFMSKDAADSAQAYNYAANMANINAGERADLRGQIAARLQRQRDEAGVTDAAGNRVYYDPVRGWVTDLSPDQQALQTATTGAQLYNLGPGEQMRREGVERGAGAQRDENQVANALLSEFERRARTDVNDLANQIYAAGEIGRVDAEDRISENVARQMVRQGATGNADDIIAARARQGSRASEEARRQAVLQAPDVAQQRDAASATNTANLYNMFRQRAVNPAGVPFSPVSPTGPRAPDTRTADAAIINAAGRRPVQYDYIQPNFAGANAMMNIGQGIGNAVSGYYQQRALDRYNDRLANQDRLLGNQGL